MCIKGVMATNKQTNQRKCFTAGSPKFSTCSYNYIYTHAKVERFD